RGLRGPPGPGRSRLRARHHRRAPRGGDDPRRRPLGRAHPAGGASLALLRHPVPAHQLPPGGGSRRGRGRDPGRVVDPALTKETTMKAYVLIETAAGKTKNVKKALAKIKSARATVAAMDAVTGPYDFIAIVDGQTLDAIGSLVTDSIGIIDGVTRTTTCVAVTVG